MSELTDRQAEIFAYIQRNTHERLMAPSVREIGARFHMQPNGVMGHIKALQRKGYITLAEGRARAMRPTKLHRSPPRPMPHQAKHQAEHQAKSQAGMWEAEDALAEALRATLKELETARARLEEYRNRALCARIDAVVKSSRALLE